MSLIYDNNKSSLIPLIETIFDNKGGESDQWKASDRILKAKPEE
jgi:hypothetical protein